MLRKRQPLAKRTAASRRSGFTLLEVLMATGIALFLLYAIYSATGMHYAQLDAGRDIAERAQLSRAILQQLRADVEATFTSWEPASASGSSSGSGDGTGAGDGTGGGTSGGSTLGTTDEASEYDIPSGGVIGDEVSLSLIVVTVPGGVDFNQALSADVPPGDLRLVRYRIATSDSEDGSLVGLIREEFPRVPESADVDPATAKTEVLAEEVETLTIRYYDGVDWLTEWDDLSTSAPAAIEFTLGVRPTSSSRQTASTSTKSGADAALTEYRFVCATVPLAAAKSAEAPTGNAGASSNSGGAAGNSSAGGNNAGNNNPGNNNPGNNNGAQP